MTVLRILMTEDHRRCDDLFALAEKAASRGDWPLAGDAFEAFRAAVMQHLDAEETQLFPAFEQATGSSMGPTRMMCIEHQEIRALLSDLAHVLAERDGEAFRGNAETLLIMMQQHNLKEENILYPMCDAQLGGEAKPLAMELRQALTAGAARLATL